jgi:hypothetical protein
MPLRDNELIEGDVVEPEYEDEPKSMWLKISSEKGLEFEALVRPLEVLFTHLREEFGWPIDQELILWDALKERRIQAETELIGGDFILRGIKNRQPMVRFQFSDEEEFFMVPAANGIEIQEFIDEQVGTKCLLKIVEKGVIPCNEDFNEEEVHSDIALTTTPLGPLPPVDPVDHSFTRDPNFCQRRESRLWRENQSQRDQQCRELFIRRRANQKYVEFWKSIELVFREAQKESVDEVLALQS